MPLNPKYWLVRLDSAGGFPSCLRTDGTTPMHPPPNQPTTHPLYPAPAHVQPYPSSSVRGSPNCRRRRHRPRSRPPSPSPLPRLSSSLLLSFVKASHLSKRFFLSFFIRLIECGQMHIYIYSWCNDHFFEHGISSRFQFIFIVMEKNEKLFINCQLH